MDSPDSEFGIGLLIGGPLKVLCGVHREDARCHQEPAHLVQEHLTSCSDTHGNGAPWYHGGNGNGNGGNGNENARTVYISASYQSCHPKTLDQMWRPGMEHQLILPINTHMLESLHICL